MDKELVMMRIDEIELERFHEARDDGHRVKSLHIDHCHVIQSVISVLALEESCRLAKFCGMN